MECSVPPPLTEDQLTAALDSTADVAIHEHLAQCPHCALRLEQARQFEQTLKRELYRYDCPTSHQLGDYHLGLIRDTEERSIARHVEQCPLCRAELEEMRLFLMDETPQLTPPVQQPPPRPVQRLSERIASLVPRTAALAMRGQRTITAKAGTTMIVVDVQPIDSENVTLIGQVIDDADEWTGALVELRQNNTLKAIATTDELGSFVIERIPPSEAEIRITPEQGQTLLLRDIPLAR